MKDDKCANANVNGTDSQNSVKIESDRKSTVPEDRDKRKTAVPVNKGKRRCPG